MPRETCHQLSYNPSPIIFKLLFHVKINVMKMIILVSPLKCDKIIYFLKILLISNIPYILNQPINQQDTYRQKTLSVFTYDCHDFSFAWV